MESQWTKGASVQKIHFSWVGGRWGEERDFSDRRRATCIIHGFQTVLQYQNPPTHKARQYSPPQKHYYQSSLLTAAPPPAEGYEN